MIVTDSDAHFVRAASRQGLEGLFQDWRTAAELDELHVGGEHFIQGAEQNVAAFLIDQTADIAEQGNVQRLWKAHLLLERLFFCLLARQTVDRKGVFQTRIILRVPLAVIRAVENADDRTLALPQNSVQSAPEFLRHDFSRVTRTHGCGQVGITEACLQAIQPPIKFDAAGVKVIPGQLGQLVSRAGKYALVREVVNGEAGPRRASPPCPLSLVFDK